MLQALALFSAALTAAELRIEIRDEQGRPAAARLEIHGPNNKMYQPAEGAILSRRPGRPATGSPYLQSFVIDKSCRVTVPPGQYRIIAERGLEYQRIEKNLTVKADTDLEIRIPRWIAMSKRGWWSGDVHVHRPMEETPTLLNAEDLNFGVVFTMWNRVNLWGDRPLPSDPIRQTAEHRWMSVTNAEDERGGGAWMLHGIRAPLGLENIVPAGKPMTSSWNPPGITFVRQARSQATGGYPWFDLEKPIWWEAPVMMALARPDSIGLLHNHYDLYGMYDNEAWGRPRDLAAFPGLTGFSDYSLQLIYRYWNLGWMVPPVAGSASGVLPNPVGYNRTYVQIDGEFTVDKWYQGIRAGRVLLTNGPVIFWEPKIQASRVSGKIEVTARAPLDRLELVANGKVVRQWKAQPGQRRLKARFDLPIGNHSWLTARAYEQNTQTVRMAHTAPIALTGKYDARADAQYYVQWIDDLLRHKETQGDEPLRRLYEQARQVYLNVPGLETLPVNR